MRNLYTFVEIIIDEGSTGVSEWLTDMIIFHKVLPVKEVRTLNAKEE